MPYSIEVGRVFEEVKKRIGFRINSNREAFAKLGLNKFYVAGGALLPAEPNDFDLFPVKKYDFDNLFKYVRGESMSKDLLLQSATRVWETTNAVTYNINGVKIQLCKFWNESLIDTVERFDFTHCKIGAEFEKIKHKGTTMFRPVDVYVSEDFIRYKILGYSEYTGVHENDYPLSSLLRVFKYIKRGYIRSSYDVIFKILEGILERGYRSEEDFKSQLEGIDVGVEEAQQLNANSASLKHIYYLLTGKAITNDDIFFRADMIGEKLG